MVRETKSGSWTKRLQKTDKKYYIENAETRGKKRITVKPRAGEAISMHSSQKEGNKSDKRESKTANKSYVPRGVKS